MLSIFEAAGLKIFNAHISASCVIDIYYIARRELKDRDLTLELLKNFLTIVKVAAVSEKRLIPLSILRGVTLKSIRRYGSYNHSQRKRFFFE